ncbi:MAG: ester cyclase [Gemmatimonadota bacterium]
MARLFLPFCMLALLVGPLAAQEMSPASIADSFSEAWEQRNEDLLETLFAPEATYQTPDAVYQGVEGVVQFLRNAFVVAPESRLEFLDEIVGDSDVALEWVWSGTHTGNLPNLPATGRDFVVHGVTVLEIEDGLITRATDYYDRFGFLQQLGVMPPAGESGSPSGASGPGSQ